VAHPTCERLDDIGVIESRALHARRSSFVGRGTPDSESTTAGHRLVRTRTDPQRNETAVFRTITLTAAEGASGNGFWLPADVNEAIWCSLAFFVVVILIYKYARKPILGYFAGRVSSVETTLEASGATRTEAESKRDAVRAALADADTESARIIADAHAAAAQIARDTETRIARDRLRIREAGITEIAELRSRAEADLTADLARLSLGAAERVVESTMDEATQQRLIDEYITSVASPN